jgi:hypothetical protein
METNKIKRIVIWGLRNRYHTHRHIHKAFYENAQKLGFNVMWVEDEKDNVDVVEAGDLVISAEVVGKMVPEKLSLEDYNLPIRDGVYYCLHNYKDIFKKKIPESNLLNLQVYKSDEAEKSDQKLGPVTYFNTKTRTLYQPWGTDLLSEEFRKPVFNKNKFVFWVGSIWNNVLNQGNLKEIGELKSVLKKNKLWFVRLRFIPDWLNVLLIRISRLAPATAGRYQVDVNYLPCRMFKNISYGQLGITNVKKFKDILGESFIDGETIAELIENALSLSREEYLNKVSAQQEIIKDYTYKNALENIINCF